MGTVLSADHSGVRVLRLNRPERRNAIDIELRVELAAALADAMADDRVRVIVLTGNGPLFCSGGDISTMKRAEPAEAAHRAELAQRVIRALWSGSKPVIAAIEGGAHGAGLSLALACDRIVAAEDSRFAISFQRVGLAGDMGIFSSLPRRIGVARAKQLLLLPRDVTTDEALDIGLVDRVVPVGTALETALEEAHRLASGPPLALAAVKRLLAGDQRLPLDLLDAEAAEQVRLFGTEDFAEGVAAFAQRRAPVFAGR